MKLAHRITALAVAAGIGLSIMVVPSAARASEEGRRNTALGLGAAAAALLLGQRDKTAGVIAAVGAAYAFSQVERDHHRWGRDRYRYDDRYSDSYYDGGYNDRYYGGGYNDRYYGGGYSSGYDRDQRDRNRDRYSRDDRNYRGDRDDRSDRYSRSDWGSRSYRR